MSLKFFDKLSQNFIELINDKDDYNVIIDVENKEESFTAHSNVLKYRSSYFRKELENIRPNENNIKIITKPSISSKIFDVILKYIYGGIANLEKAETRFIFDLMLIANEFELVELSNKLETILIEDKASWLKTHFSLVYRTIFVKENFCNDIVVKYPNLIFDSSDFISLPESALVSLLKQDDLQMKEVEIWDYVIKMDQKKFSHIKNHFTTMPRYFHITNIEIYDKISPYKKILGKQLWEDIKQHLTVSDRPIKSIILPARLVFVTELLPRTTEPFSTIISENHAAEISIKGTDEIIGGYNSLALDNSNIGDKWMKTKDSFIFLLKNGNIQNSILSRVIRTDRAILNIDKIDHLWTIFWK
ncbi:hypothetical protein Glove_33g200 [Diversispora epigaea]|uniref:BTB domain-containing protein n=1 Tax=Diversispora epigaea TaxID=1348612 RepID=A0A397JNN1_9GLOM|nr:hypothetical protein Glove_33g200 [Diversispora epigaea]